MKQEQFHSTKDHMRIQKLRASLRRIVVHNKLATAINTDYAKLSKEMAAIAQEGLRQDETD